MAEVSDRDATLAEAAAHYWVVAELDLDEADPDDHVAVLRKAFTESDCDAFAWMLHRMTGWPVVKATFQHPSWGFGHHSLVEAPDGRLLDVRGFQDRATAARRCCRMKDVAVSFSEAPAEEPVTLVYDDAGVSDEAVRIAAVIRNLPYAPFSSRSFREMSSRPVEGVDVPMAAPPAP